jgi:hypothetical protein
LVGIFKSIGGIGLRINFICYWGRVTAISLTGSSRERRFKDAAGAWKNIDTDTLVKELYAARTLGTRWDITLD